MRLDDRYKYFISKAAVRLFGDDTHVYLFGSRVQDSLKGGDIDLLVIAAEDKMTFKNKVLFLIDLKKELGDQKIDVVFDKENENNQFFLKTIKQKSTQLC
ncbi:MAG: nucleotidyltransferase domain-containing protein [Bacteroidetes bacterium]|nr:MAG: nucleotidyltransferase domain-containing protein [Bacteroidota bacterium]